MNPQTSPEQAYLENLRVRPQSSDGPALAHDLLGELRQYFSVPASVSDEELLHTCQQGSARLIQEWRDRKIDAGNPDSILKFYSETHAYCYELVALDLAVPEDRKKQLADFVAILKKLGKRRGLDFGSGIGTTGIYLMRSGLELEFADVSATNLGFIQHRLRNRGLESKTHLLPDAQISAGSYDFVLAMDVLEHVADPIKKLRELRTYLRPGGVLIFNVITSHEDEDPLHIMHDPALIRKRVRGLGFTKIGAIGEFKVYQRVERPGVLNAAWTALDTAFWTVRVAIKGH